MTDMQNPKQAAPAAVAVPVMTRHRTKDGILHFLTKEQMAEEIIRLDAALAAAPTAQAAPAAVAGAALDVLAIAAAVCQRVAELPDRNSPEDWPEAMLVTGAEMIDAVACEIEQALAAAAPTIQAAPQPADPQELLPEIQRLQRALAFWLPMVPSEDHPLQERIAHDAFLLAEYYGPDEPSAYELGHVALAGTGAPVAQGDALTQAARDVLAERQRQISDEGWTPEHDDTHGPFALGTAAGCYAMYTLAFPEGDPPPGWPWATEWWKPRDHRRNLVKAGALILAELERFDRYQAHEGGAA